MENIDELRKEMDDINKELAELLVKRFGIVEKIGEYKQVKELPIYNPLRERAVMNSVKEVTGGCISEGHIERIFEEIIEESKMFQKTRLLGNIYLIGMPGAGKSIIGRMLADRFSRSFIDADSFFKERYGLSAAECISISGEDYFRQLETMCLYDISKTNCSIVALGGGVVEKETNRKVIGQNSIVIYIKRPLRKLDKRNRPISEELGPELIYLRRHKAYEDWSDFEIDNIDTPEYAVNLIVNRLISE